MDTLSKQHVKHPQPQGDHHNGHRILQRVDQRRQGNDVFRKERRGKLIYCVSKETTCQHPEHGSGDSQVLSQLKHVSHRPLGTILFGDPQGDCPENQAIGQVCKHHAEKHHKESKDQRIRINSSPVSRQGVHLCHHVDTGKPLLIFQQRRGNLLGIRFPPFIGTENVAQFFFQPGQPRLGNPPLQKNHCAIGENFFPRLLLLEFLLEAVLTKFQFFPLALASGNGLDHVLPFPLILKQFLFHPTDVLRRCPCTGLPVRNPISMGPQALRCPLQRLLMTDQQEIPLMLILGNLLEMGSLRSFLQLCGQFGQIHRQRASSQLKYRCGRFLKFKRKVQRGPRHQTGFQVLQIGLLGLELCQLPVPGIDLFRQRQGLFHRFLPEKILFPDGLPLNEQS